MRISVGTSTKINKAKKLSSRIFENVPNENCSRLTEKKKTKTARASFFLASDKPENHTIKGKEKNMEQRGERKASKKKAMAALLVSLC